MIDDYIKRLKEKELLTSPEISYVCDLVRPIFHSLPNVISLQSPRNVCGDIHGLLNDPESNYLFMGDFVQRGMHSCETILFLLCMKMKYPENISLIRGNHECRKITQVYGFCDVITRKFGDAQVWKMLTDLFDVFHLAATVDDRILCVHGGLSPGFMLHALCLMRQKEIPHEGTMCDLLWSDPENIKGFGVSPRGAGYSFCPNITQDFLATNNLNLLRRAHQLMMDGHSFTHEENCLTLSLRLIIVEDVQTKQV